MPGDAIRFYKENMPATLHKNGYSFEEISLYVRCVQKTLELEMNHWGMWFRDYAQHHEGWNWKHPKPEDVFLIQKEQDAWIFFSKAVVSRNVKEEANIWASFTEEECTWTGGTPEWNFKYTAQDLMKRRVAQEILTWVQEEVTV